MNLTPSLIYGIIACILLVELPHADYLPPWMDACGLLVLGWRAYIAWAGIALPPRWLLLLVTVAGAGGIFFEYHTLFGRDAGVTLLILLTTLKLMEMRTLRDAIILIYLSCFICITHFFYSQSIPAALYMLFTLWVILSVWMQMHGGALPLKPRLRFAGILLAQAIPLSLLLFVLFPRVQGPLWGMPQDAYSTTGLSDSMSPGSMSKLSLSQAVAFRVTFEGAAPPPRSMMYWRGPVLWDLDGNTWRGSKIDRFRQAQISDTAMPVDYTVTLEPHNKNWLFALDMPERVSITASMTDDFQLHARQPLTSRIRYSAKSNLQYRANPEELPEQLQRALNLPPAINPRARNLASNWRNTLADNNAIIQAALNRFSREKFSYTLEPPPLLADNPLDEFLFETRQGFCEHYASSFVFLMRAAGIPARVVTGYQGGEYNPEGDYLIVRQADAHAWAEVWLAGRGWLRIDPTAAISPERISNGLTAAMPDSPALPLIARVNAGWLLKLRFNLDKLNHQWNQWVLGYNPERQFALLKRLGMEDVQWQYMALNLLIGSGILVGIYALLMLRSLYKRSTDPAQAAYLKFCKKLARAGVVRAAHEGPHDFARRAASLLPDHAGAIQDITAWYLRVRYTAYGDRNDLLALRREVAAFRL